MTAKHRMEQLEQQLRQEADHLSGGRTAASPVGEILAVHARRARMRTRRMVHCGVASVLAVLALYGAWHAPRPASNGTAGIAPMPGRVRQELSPMSSNDKPAPAATAQADARQPGPAANAPVAAIGPEAIDTRSVPFLIIHSDGEQHSVIGAGLYVPEHVEEVNLPDLTPAEQRAVRTVLGLGEGPEGFNEVI